MAYFSISPNGSMTEVQSFKSFATVEDTAREDRFADELQSRYRLGIPAKFTKDGGLLVAGNAKEAIAAANVFSQSVFSTNMNVAPNIGDAFKAAVVPFRSIPRPSITGAMHLAA